MQYRRVCKTDIAAQAVQKKTDEAAENKDAKEKAAIGSQSKESCMTGWTSSKG